MPNLALFDFDNTITTSDNFKPFIYFSVSRKRLLLGQTLLAPLLVGYKLGFIHATHVRSRTTSFKVSEGEISLKGSRRSALTQEPLDSIPP